MPRRALFAWFLAAAAAALAGWIVLRDDPLGLLRRCPLRAWTGIPCPTCHGTEALRGLVGGDWRGAFTANPLAAALLLFVPVSGLLALLAVPVAGRLPRLDRIGLRPAFLVLAMLMVLNWIYLLLRSG